MSLDILREDKFIPNLYLIPLIRMEDIYTEGLTMEEIIDISGKNISLIKDKNCIKKLNTFLHPGRNELMLADNIILVE